ncbi:MAG TPA: helicase-related protein [Spirochaetota bacterium]|nr:helicase-related protein [Spirochaetota bacterium]HOM39137.1 helicase-related protein [Spirochaetota bacterium]HPQ50040.1 helicase-related protein [Spirochaetota bacterium]
MSNGSFIINEKGKSLKERFNKLIGNAQSLDCIVAYFYLSGFHHLYKTLENTKKIRIIVGIGLDRESYELIKQAESEKQEKLPFSNSEIKNIVEKRIEDEIADSDDNQSIEEGIRKFVEWIKTKKLEIRAYPSANLHAKVYIFTFKEIDRDEGRVITGSSNFTAPGLVDNLEFNVELSNPADYSFAKEKFEKLWEESIDVTEKYVQTINQNTYLNKNISPYELYLKFLYEYFKDELNKDDDIFVKHLPPDFRKLEYQRQAVLNAKKIVEEYGGVFISDVVGLGKTYITSMLVSQLDGRTLVIAPPALLTINNPGSWPNVFSDFRIQGEFFSIGKLDDAKEYINKYEETDHPVKNIVIDEAHRFRNENTISYEDIAEICRGKRVILISATPYNNSPADILAQLKLFQNVKKSTIPGLTDIEEFFIKLQKELKKVDMQNNYQKFLEITKINAKEIRDKLLKYIMVRRTRSEIEKYFSEDLKKNNIKFPDVEDPKPLYYKLNKEENKIFMDTIELITQKLKYSRYMPLLYLNKKVDVLIEQSQKNMACFMKVLLIKRLESSFYAFRKSIDRFINSYKLFIKEYENGKVYISKRINKIFELIQENNEDEIQELIDKGEVNIFKSTDFDQDFEKDLKNDLEILEKIKLMWNNVKRDPKLETLLYNLKNHQILSKDKVIIFTESKETSEYLAENINNHIGKIALSFYGGLKEDIRDKVIENFDAKVKNKKDDYRILITTDALSEGVNLHRSNIVINYDIPWNPTKIIQRVGRVNRVDTPFDKIYTFNFFPTEETDSEIKLTNIARSKIEAFLTLLGGDSSILTEGEPVASHELFDKLISKKTITKDEYEEEESELKYLRIIQEIQEKNPELFKKIKSLPKKAKTGKQVQQELKEKIMHESLLTFFRKGKLMKFFLSNKNETFELNFINAAKIFETSIEEKKIEIPIEKYYQLLDKNKTAFFKSTTEEMSSLSYNSKNNYKQLMKILKALDKSKINEEQKKYIQTLINKLENSQIPKKSVQDTLRNINKLGKDKINTLKIIEVINENIPLKFLEDHYVRVEKTTDEKREVILSFFLGT